jgi:hypothetical protein
MELGSSSLYSTRKKFFKKNLQNFKTMVMLRQIEEGNTKGGII